MLTLSHRQASSNTDINSLVNVAGPIYKLLLVTYFFRSFSIFFGKVVENLSCSI